MDANMVLAEGKTKRIIAVEDRPTMGDVISKDDITAGDGAKHDVIPDKGRMATQTTCNVFRLLKACDIPVAFDQQINATTFRAPLCKMLPLEVVVRREAHGSYLKCYPQLEKGHLFPRLLVQFFLKTSGKKWKGHDLVCDDPLMGLITGFDGNRLIEIRLFNPKLPMVSQEPFLTLAPDVFDVFTQPDPASLLRQMDHLARQTFLVLEKAWQLQGRTLVDFKVEFGIGPDGTLLLADVIDNDSWRLLSAGGHYLDKQVYRDGGDLSQVAHNYHLVSELTNGFNIPRQQIIIWTGSDKDDIKPIVDALVALGYDSLDVSAVVCSVHKEPIQAIEMLHKLIQKTPDSVIIARIGRSNGAGPVLSAQTTVPVITVPESFKSFPDDVWSSLRGPSNVPVMTVLESANAALAAMNILSARSPRIYMILREKLEERLVNYVRVL